MFCLDFQMKNLEDNLAEVLSSCEYVDQAIENATPTQLLLVRKQVNTIQSTIIVTQSCLLSANSN